MFGIYLWKGEDHFGNRKSGELEAKNRREAENKLLPIINLADSESGLE